jgi:hypothetical protein
MPVNTLVIYCLGQFSIRVPSPPVLNDPAVLGSAHQSAKSRSLSTSFPRHHQSSVLSPGPSEAFPLAPLSPMRLGSWPHRRSALYLFQGRLTPSSSPRPHRRSAPYLLQGRLTPSSPPRRCLSSFSRYVQEIRAPSSGSSPLLPPAAAAQSAAIPTLYHGDGFLVPSVEVLRDIPKYICIIVLSIISSL